MFAVLAVFDVMMDTAAILPAVQQAHAVTRLGLLYYPVLFLNTAFLSL
jgi:hypothetical protein